MDCRLIKINPKMGDLLKAYSNNSSEKNKKAKKK